MERDQKLNRLEEAHSELVHQIWAQSDQQYICNWAETATQIIIRGLETARIQPKVSNGLSGNEKPMLMVTGRGHLKMCGNCSTNQRPAIRWSEIQLKKTKCYSGWGGPRSVWLKTKVGSQKFIYQLWCLFCNICNVLKNMFIMSLIIMW